MDYLPELPITVTPLIAFGLMLFIGAIGGFFAHRWPWFPSITGFMLVGLGIGPSGLNLITDSTLLDARILVDIALALILYRLGLALDIKRILRDPAILFVSLAESAATGLLVFFPMHWIGVELPVALLVSAIVMSSSPSVLLHVAHEMGAKGPVTGSTKTLVAMNNIFSYLAFSALLPVLLYTDGASWEMILLQPLYRVIGSLLLGVIMAFALYRVSTTTHNAPQYHLALVIGTVMVGIGLAYELKLSVLFVPLVIGVVVRSLERRRLISKLDFGPAFELFFIVLFVSAGASMHVQAILDLGWPLLIIVAARVLAKVTTVVGLGTMLNRSPRASLSSGLLLVPMAGLAIGLVQTSGNLFPQYAASISALVFGAVAVFETIGPPIAAFAFRFSGEAGKSTPDADMIQDYEQV
jgi:Kef-type K+ transport system membrane component KefB